MASMGSWRILRNWFFSFENREASPASTKADSRFVVGQEVNPNQSWAHYLGEKFTNPKCIVSIYRRYWGPLLSICNKMFFTHCFFNFFDAIGVNRVGWTTRLSQAFDDLSTFTEYFQWFRSRQFSGNTKFQANSLFNSFLW